MSTPRTSGDGQAGVSGVQRAYPKGASERPAQPHNPTVREDGTLGPDPRRGRFGSGYIVERLPSGAYLRGTRWPSGRTSLEQRDPAIVSRTRLPAFAALAECQRDFKAALQRGDIEAAGGILRYAFGEDDLLPLIRENLARETPAFLA